MGILGWILFGFVVGLIARAVMPGRDPMGLIGTTVLGIIGALFAGWIGQAAGLYGSEDGAGFVAATLGAVIVLLAYHAIVRRRSIASTRSNAMTTFSDENRDVNRQDRAA